MPKALERKVRWTPDLKETVEKVAAGRNRKPVRVKAHSMLGARNRRFSCRVDARFLGEIFVDIVHACDQCGREFPAIGFPVRLRRAAEHWMLRMTSSGATCSECKQAESAGRRLLTEEAETGGEGSLGKAATQPGR